MLLPFFLPECLKPSRQFYVCFENVLNNSRKSFKLADFSKPPKLFVFTLKHTSFHFRFETPKKKKKRSKTMPLNQTIIVLHLSPKSCSTAFFLICECLHVFFIIICIINYLFLFCFPASLLHPLTLACFLLHVALEGKDLCVCVCRLRVYVSVSKLLLSHSSAC